LIVKKFMTPSETRWWFKRRRYGRGWALLKTWQGWLLSVTYLGLLALGWRLFAEEAHIALSAYVLVLTACGLGVCWWKGEPSLWRGTKPDEQASSK